MPDMHVRVQLTSLDQFLWPPPGEMRLPGVPQEENGDDDVEVSVLISPISNGALGEAGARDLKYQVISTR